MPNSRTRSNKSKFSSLMFHIVWFYSPDQLNLKTNCGKALFMISYTEGYRGAKEVKSQLLNSSVTQRQKHWLHVNGTPTPAKAQKYDKMQDKLGSERSQTWFCGLIYSWDKVICKFIKNCLWYPSDKCLKTAPQKAMCRAFWGAVTHKYA